MAVTSRRRVRRCRRRPDALGRRRGRGVEGPGGGRAPVHQQRAVLVVLVEEAEPADVADLTVVGVQPAERETVLSGPERSRRSV